MALKINLPEEEVLSMYIDDGMSKSKISKHFNVDPNVIQRILKYHQIPIRQNDFYSTKFSFNKKFFEAIDTEEKAYWLGFIYADGYITKGKTMGIKISKNDIGHLEKFKKSIESSHSINTYRCTSGYSNTDNSFCQIEIHDLENVENLKRQGVVEKKSKILTFPNDIPENLIRHFIRGYFDGDGSVYYNSKNMNVSFIGTLDMMENIKNHLPSNTNSKVYKCKNKDIYEVKLGGRNMIEPIYDYFYKDSTIFLERKASKFTEAISFFSERKKKTELSEEDVLKIKSMIKVKVPRKEISKIFNISTDIIGNIARGRTFKDIN